MYFFIQPLGGVDSLKPAHEHKGGTLDGGLDIDII